MSWVLLALAAPAFYALANLTDKILLTRYVTSPLGVLALFGLYAPIVVAAIAAVHGLRVDTLEHAGLLLVAGAGIVAFEVLYLQSLMREEVSTVIPLLQVYPLLALLLAASLLHQVLPPRAAISFIAIFIGGTVLAVDRPADLRRMRLRRGAAFMLGGAVVLAWNNIVITVGAEHVDVWTAVACEYAGYALAIAVLFIVVPSFRRSALRQTASITTPGLAAIACSVIFTVCAYASLTAALAGGPVALVSALNGAQPIYVFAVALALSRWLPAVLEENVSRGRVIEKACAVALISVGVGLLPSG